jgi:hypothetical protein
VTFPDDETAEIWPEDAWDPVWDEDDGTGSSSPAWRRPLLIAVAAVTAIALIVVPVYNVLIDRSVAENGLDVCGFDYCIVEAAVREAGFELEMSSLYNTILGDEEAVALGRELTEALDVDPVGVVVVDDLEGRVGGVYDPDTRSIAIERPARAWTVLHEVAHVIETGHDDDFQQVLISLTRDLTAD